MTYSEFLQKEDLFIQTIATVMESVLINMGEDIKGISWFSAYADSYMAQKFDIARAICTSIHHSDA